MLGFFTFPGQFSTDQQRRFVSILNPKHTSFCTKLIIYIVNEPADYYERLINKMIGRKMVKPVDARIIAEQYNYISIILTKEYIMAQYGLADANSVVGYIKTLKFFCGLMKNDGGDYGPRGNP